MDIIEKLKELGATQTQLESRTTQLVLQAFAEDASVIPDTAKREIKSLISAVNAASDRLEKAESRFDSLFSDIEKRTAQVAAAAKKAETDFERAQKLQAMAILDPDLREATKAYREVLAATMEEFGVLMKNDSTDVMVAAINAGSYIAWRGVMGPKNEAAVEHKEKWRNAKIL